MYTYINTYLFQYNLERNTMNPPSVVTWHFRWFRLNPTLGSEAFLTQGIQIWVMVIQTRLWQAASLGSAATHSCCGPCQLYSLNPLTANKEVNCGESFLPTTKTLVFHLCSASFNCFPIVLTRTYSARNHIYLLTMTCSAALSEHGFHSQFQKQQKDR